MKIEKPTYYKEVKLRCYFHEVSSKTMFYISESVSHASRKDMETCSPNQAMLQVSKQLFAIH